MIMNGIPDWLKLLKGLGWTWARHEQSKDETLSEEKCLFRDWLESIGFNHWIHGLVRLISQPSFRLAVLQSYMPTNRQYISGSYSSITD
jgi:hypothetical protein